MCSNQNKFRILALDGGGIRGALIASFLAEVEGQLKRPLSDYFDLIAGTSTGGIIALALGLGERLEEICEFYRQAGPRIFEPARVRLPFLARLCNRVIRTCVPGTIAKSDLERLYDVKYRAEPLRLALAEMFGHRTLGDAVCSRLVIPAVDLVNGQTVTFKTPHQPNFTRDLHYQAVDVGVATAAAPLYFPVATINGLGVYCDGGLWANNPSVIAIAEAIKISQVCRRPGLDPRFEVGDIAMLSIGTGRARYYFRPDHLGQGLIGWGTGLFDVAAGAQAQGEHFKARYLLGEDHYMRIDFDLPAPWKLDEIGALPDLINLGRQKATECYSQLFAGFFSHTKQPVSFYNAA